MLRPTAPLWTLLLTLPLAAGCGASAGGGFDPDAGASDAPVAADDRPASGDRPAADAGGGEYTEAVCDSTADLADLAGAYQNTPDGLRAAVRGIAERRYPIGLAFVDVQSDAQLTAWFSQRNTFMQVLNSAEVAFHEGGHIWDFSNGMGGMSFRVRDDLIIRTRRLSNFNRSEIGRLHANPSADQYFNTYLTGQLGAQGFGTLLDEYLMYTHSLASRYCTRDGLQRGTRISSRDGILTFMYYVELYLKLARTEHPDDYAEIVGDPGHVQLIRTVWRRAEFWLARTASIAELGLRDAMIRTWTYDPANVMEIEMLPPSP